MAKDDKKNLHQEVQNQFGRAGTEYDALNAKIGGRGDTTWDRATEDYKPAYEGYLDYAQGGGLKPEDIERMRNAWGNVGGPGGGGGGGASAPRLGPSAYANLSSAYGNAYRPEYGESDTVYRGLTGKGGGFDQAQLDKIYGNVDTLTGIGQTGGITEEDKANILRKQMLDQEQTGGYSEQDKALVRAKSAASSPAYFGALKDNLARQRGATGNLANAGAVDFKLARQGAQQQGQDRLTQEMALQESVRGGKERAGQFLSGQAMDLAGLRTANQLAGARSGGELGLSTQQGITANQARGAEGLAGSQTNLGQWGLQKAGGLDYFGLNKAGGLDQHAISQAQMDLQASMANAASSAASGYASARDKAMYEQWVTEYGNEQKQYGIGGLESLYNTNLTASRDFSQLGLQGLECKYGPQYNLLGLANQTRGSTLGENAGLIGGLVGSGANAWNAMKGIVKPGGGKDDGTARPTGPGQPSTPGYGFQPGYSPKPGYGFGGGGGAPTGPGGYRDDAGNWVPYPW